MNSWTPLYILDGLALAIFAVSYYRNCYRRGYRIDFWHAQIFLYVVLPSMLLLPFARDELNAVIVGQDFAGIVAVIPSVFLLTMVGYLSVLVGGSLWRLRLGVGGRRAVKRLLDAGPRCSMMLMASRDVLVVLTLLCFFSQIAILAMYFSHNGFGFDIRAYTFENPGVRPFAQISALSSMMIASHCAARYMESKERVLLLCALLLTFGLLFFGQRGNIVYTYLNLALCYMVQRGSRMSLLRIVGTAGVGVLVILYLGSLRGGEYGWRSFFASVAFLLIYGNNFCELRDFAWIYSRWDHGWWFGRTYLAGLATFIPRGASDFRATWSFGTATDRVVGLDPELHPGLKPGIFGESYFNFGWFGVVVVGLILGITFRRVDLDVKAALRFPKPSIAKAFASTIPINIALCVAGSLGLPGLYALLGMYFLGWICLKAQALILRPHGLELQNLGQL